MLLSCVLIIALALNYEVRECTGTISRKRHTRYSYVPVELDFMQEFGGKCIVLISMEFVHTL